MTGMLVLALLVLAPAQMVAGEWKVSERRDAIEDTAEIYAVVGSQRQHLAVGCDKSLSPGLRLIFRSGQYLGDERRGLLAGGRDIALRFDDHEPMRWRAEYEKDGVIEDQQKQVRAVLGQLKSSRKVVVRALTYEHAEVDTVFTYAPPAQAIDDVLERCAPKQ